MNENQASAVSESAQQASSTQDQVQTKVVPSTTESTQSTVASDSQATTPATVSSDQAEVTIPEVKVADSFSTTNTTKRN